jgi:CheY-like chemotaxis protein
MHTWLQGAGHEVMEASDGRQAVKVLNSADALVDLVVTDVYMPEADGFELVTYCRNRGIRVVAMSGGHPKIPLDVLDVARTMGACATLQKPFEKAELLQAIERAVGSGAG